MTDRSVETRDQRAHESRAHESEEHPIIIETKRARAGRKGVPILYVLLISTALAVIAFAIIYGAFFHHIR